MKKGLIATLLSVVGLLSGCATIIGGGQPSIIQLNSSPISAKVTARGINNGERLTGITPTSLTLNKNSDYEIVFELSGYESKAVIVRRSINGWFWGNLIIGGIPGWIIDAATNEMWVHSTTVIDMDLTSAMRNDDNTLSVFAVIQYLDEYNQPHHARVPVLLYPKG